MEKSFSQYRDECLNRRTLFLKEFRSCSTVSSNRSDMKKCRKDVKAKYSGQFKSCSIQ